MILLISLLLPAFGQLADFDREHAQVRDYYLARIGETPALRAKRWKAPAGERRARLRAMLGVLDATVSKGRASGTAEVWEGTMVRALAFFPSRAGRHAAVIVVPPEDRTAAEHAAEAWLARLVEQGNAVIVPQLPERLQDHPLSKQFRGKDRRHILHRLGWVTGHSVTGLDVGQLMAITGYAARHPRIDAARLTIRGGMAAFYAAALDTRLTAASVSGYFNERERAWREPVDRMIHGQLLEFGDAEVAALIAPRKLTLIRGDIPKESFERELARARRLSPNIATAEELAAAADTSPGGWTLDRDAHFGELLDHLRQRIAASEAIRERTRHGAAELRAYMGAVTEPRLPLKAQLRKLGETEAFEGFEVLLPVLEGVDAYGHLLLPKKVGARGPAVITQHGLGGKPKDLTLLGPEPNVAYHGYAARLAEQGYVVFAPYVVHPIPQVELINPLVRQADLIGRMRISLELARLSRIVDYLQSLPAVDPANIHYYGLSYGGYSAIWMGPLEPRLKTVIVSGHFNDWRTKITNEEKSTSYLLHPDEDFYNWDVLHRFTHVELIAAMAPRPVLVEFAHRDSTTFPEWHERAWAKVRSMAHASRDHFDGVHEIHGLGAFDFLRRWARPELGAGRDGPPFVTRVLQPGERIRGSFHVPAGNPVFRGIAFRAGGGGKVAVRFKGIGDAHVTGQSEWMEASVAPRRLRPGAMHEFEIAGVEGEVLITGPAPLGGVRFAEDFAVSFRLR